MARNEIKVTMGLDSTKLQRGMARVRTSLGNFAAAAVTKVAGISAAVVGVQRAFSSLTDGIKAAIAEGSLLR